MSRPAGDRFVQRLAGKSGSNEIEIANYFVSIGYVFEYLNVGAPGVEESHDGPIGGTIERPGEYTAVAFAQV